MTERKRSPRGGRKPADAPPAGSAPAPQNESPPRAASNLPLKAPKRVRFGIKLKSPDTFDATNEVAARCLRVFDAMVDNDGMIEGFDYARQGQIIAMDIEPGIATAQVQGRRGRPYSVSVKFPTLSSDQWNRLINAMAGEAMHAAKLLAGELPEQFSDVLSALGLPPFLPAVAADANADACAEADDDAGAVSHLADAESSAMLPKVDCACGYPRPCKHAAALGYLLVERLNAEPLLALTFMGMTADRFLEQLRQARAVRTQGVATAHPDQLAGLAPLPLPLEACVDDFWRYGSQLAELEQATPPHHVPHALLRRLGPSPIQGRFPLAGLLASIYDTVTKSALELRDRAERSE
jgi:uncharacterized Zn finger protein